VPVSERALVARVNRHLVRKGKRGKLMRTKGAAAKSALGRYFLLEGNRVLETHVDLETFARKLGVLARYDVLS